MTTTSHTFRGRRAVTIENSQLRLTVLEEGGHVAELFDKNSGINPLWTPQWPSLEPSAYGGAHDKTYGTGSDARLLAGIMGHNLCLDIFGGPSSEEAAAGFGPHGEASVVPYEIDARGAALAMRAALPEAQLRVDRQIELVDGRVRVREAVVNLAATDRPVGWTEHVTLGAPFVERGVTEFRVSATRSKVNERVFGTDDYLVAGAVFDWPYAPRTDGTAADLQRYTGATASSAYTTHLMDPSREHAYFVAFSPHAGLAFGCVWRRADFPWMGMWEENHSRTQPPWNGRELTRGMEFGVSPFAESRREMIERGRLFDVPTFRWIPAKTRVEVEYWMVAQAARRVPDALTWPG